MRCMRTLWQRRSVCDVIVLEAAVQSRQLFFSSIKTTHKRKVFAQLANDRDQRDQ